MNNLLLEQDLNERYFTSRRLQPHLMLLAAEPGETIESSALDFDLSKSDTTET